MIVALQGGLANQAFQLAFGLSVAKRREEEVFFTKYLLDSDPNGRKYELHHFAADVKIVEREEPPIVQDTWFYNPTVFTEGNSFIGHWQSEKYFDPPLVRQALELREKPSALSLRMAEKIRNQPSAFLHIRRGDYTLPDRIAYHGQCSLGYYGKAIEHIIRSTHADVRFFVFSDDPQWCREKFPAFFTVVDHNLERAHEDLWLMSLCRHGVIANSSFSLMGALLGDAQQNRIIVAPEKWFAISLPSQDVVPERWTKMDNE